MEIKELKLNPNNPRQINDDKFKKLCESIKSFPKMMELRPIVVGKDMMILGGNMRYKALQELGYTEIPDSWIKVADKLTDEEKKRFIVEDNLPFGEWNFDELANQFEVDDLLEWGFDEKDLKIEMEVEEDDVPEVPEEAKSKLGEIYQLGEHRLMCGDATKTEDVEKLMNGQKADMVFTDPPYNVNYSGRGKNTTKNIENDNMSIDDFYVFLSKAFDSIKKTTKTGGCIYVCHADGKPMVRVVFETEFNNYFTQSCTIIWVKNVASMSWQDYRGQHEPILYGWNGGEHQFYGNREQTTIWDIRRETNYKHPTMKPIALVVKAIRNSSKEDDLVSDIFGGSGTTLIACEQLNRKCYMMELEPKYIDVIIKRWEQFTGNKAKKL